MLTAKIKTPDELIKNLSEQNYVAGQGLAVSLFLALKRQRLFSRGEAGVGKTEIAKVLANLMCRDLICLQCYEGLDIHQAV